MYDLRHTVHLPAEPARVLAALDSRGPQVQGELAVKVGPVTSRYAGTIRLVQRDPVQHRLVLEVDAAEVAGTSRFLAKVDVRLAPEAAGGTVASVQTSAETSGRLGLYGEAMVDALLGRLLRDLVDELTAAGYPEPALPMDLDLPPVPETRPLPTSDVSEQPMPVFTLEADDTAKPPPLVDPAPLPPLVIKELPAETAERVPAFATKPKPEPKQEPEPEPDPSLAAKAAPYAIVLLLLWILRRMFAAPDD